MHAKHAKHISTVFQKKKSQIENINFILHNNYIKVYYSKAPGKCQILF